MARTLPLVALILLAVGSLFLMVRRRPSAAGQESQKGFEAYLGLRNLMLTGSRAKFSLPATSRPTEPWGVVMDWGVQTGTATVVAMSDGSASIYVSSAGGSLGGIGVPAIREAAQKAVHSASDVQPEMKETKSFALPETGQVRFYALTDAGVFSAAVPEADLRAGQGPFLSLGNAMQEIISAYRVHEQSYQKPSS